MAEKTYEDIEKEMQERHRKEQEVIDLRLKLSSQYSDLGDWKISKIQEARLLGNPDPYDIDDLHEKRQAIREQIEALQKELNALTVDDKPDEVDMLDRQYEADKRTLKDQYVEAVAMNDSETAKDVQAQLAELNTAYDEQYKALITEGE